MFHIKPMISGDFSFATKLANTMNWNMAIEDFEFNAALEPEGCLIALQDSQRIGIATCISFGRVGWFGNLVVKEEYRNKGVGSLLVKHAVNYLQDKGVQTVGLYAYQNLIDFYGNLGFKQDGNFCLLSTETLDSLTTRATEPKVAKEKIAEILEFDAKYFGANRKKVLEPIILEKSNLSYYVSDISGTIGYVAATVYEKMAWVGPLICEEGNADVAVSLIKTVLSKLTGVSVYLVPQKKETALLNMLSSIGFKEDFCVTRMFLGKSVAKNCIYMPESLERG